MYGNLKEQLKDRLADIESQGLYKKEREILSPQGCEISVEKGKVLNFCANNYLGLSSDPELIKAAHDGLEEHGFGLSSVRFICGTQDIHRELERKVSAFVGLDDTILFSSCFDANGGVFEALFDKDDAIISDALNHASIIDGIRLCKAQRFRYANCDMADLESKLKEASGARNRIIVTDGAFSMDGLWAPLKEICDLADKYNALVMVDDSHATGFAGKGGRGTHEMNDVMGRVDIITSTFGKALGGASGGFVSAHQEIVDMLRQKARPYLFSNSVSPMVITATLRALELVSDPNKGGKLREQLRANTEQFRGRMKAAGFTIKPGDHPVVPVMLGDAKLSQEMARDLLAENIYVIGFFYPVVPKNEARIRVQLSAAHTTEQIDQAVEAFIKVGKKHGVVS